MECLRFAILQKIDEDEQRQIHQMLIYDQVLKLPTVLSHACNSSKLKPSTSVRIYFSVQSLSLDFMVKNNVIKVVQYFPCYKFSLNSFEVFGLGFQNVFQNDRIS